jgi:DNA-binding MarR family transcriptional regulator
MKRKATTQPLPTRFAGPGDSPGFLLWKISNAWQRRQREALLPFELTHAQFVLLATATWHSDSETLTQARLAELSGVDPMTTSQIARTLESAGLVKRREHPEDPRAKEITTTTAGREKARAALLVVEKTDSAFFGADAPNLIAVLKSLSKRSAESKPA